MMMMMMMGRRNGAGRRRRAERKEREKWRRNSHAVMRMTGNGKETKKTVKELNAKMMPKRKMRMKTKKSCQKGDEHPFASCASSHCPAHSLLVPSLSHHHHRLLHEHHHHLPHHFPSPLRLHHHDHHCATACDHVTVVVSARHPHLLHH